MTGNPAPPLPNLLIAGVGKSGTTSLFSYLAQHPDICGSGVKETHYFSPLRTGGTLAPIEEYRRHFAAWRGEPYLLEASPDYCVGGPRLREALRDMLPNVHVLMVLRDPVERLWDNYWYMKSKLALPDVDSFDAYVAEGLARRRAEEPRDLAVRHSGWARSFYGDFLGAWLDEFGSRVRVLFFDDLVGDPTATVADVCTWLDIDPSEATHLDYSVHNSTVGHRSATLHRCAIVASRAGAAALRRRPRLKERLHRGYLALNRAEAPAHTMPSTTRRALQAATASSNLRAADQLTRHGYTRLPDWLTDPATTTTPAVPA